MANTYVFIYILVLDILTYLVLLFSFFNIAPLLFYYLFTKWPWPKDCQVEIVLSDKAKIGHKITMISSSYVVNFVQKKYIIYVVFYVVLLRATFKNILLKANSTKLNAKQTSNKQTIKPNRQSQD